MNCKNATYKNRLMFVRRQGQHFHEAVSEFHESLQMVRQNEVLLLGPNALGRKDVFEQIFPLRNRGWAGGQVFYRGHGLPPRSARCVVT